MAVGTYLERPEQWQCAQWDGTNSVDITTVLASVSWSWSVDGSGNGNARTPFGGSIPVAVGTWVIAGNGSPQFLSDVQFAAQFVSGSSWAVSP